MNIAALNVKMGSGPGSVVMVGQQSEAKRRDEGGWGGVYNRFFHQRGGEHLV